MIVTAWNPQTEDLEKTYLTGVTAAAAAYLTVRNADRFPTNKFVLIGDMGYEQSEIVKTTTPTTTPNTRINLDAGTATKFAHSPDDPIYLMRYDQIQFYRSATVDGTYTLLGAVAIDVDNKDTQTVYDDTTGTGSSYYKTKYYNSVTFEESDFSDYISALGRPTESIGHVIEGVVRSRKDPSYSVLSSEDYLDIANEVNNDILGQSERPYNFMRKAVLLNRVASQNYIQLPTDYYKFYQLEYTTTFGGYPKTGRYTPVSNEKFDTSYGSMAASDTLSRITIDDEVNRILLKPAPSTNATGAYKLWYYTELADFTELSQLIQTPSPAIYRYKFLSEFYTIKAETDSSFGALATKYEQKYGNELMKLQRSNRKDVGTARSFADSLEGSSRNDAPRRRYTL